MNTMTKILAVLLLSAISLLADVSGKWTGSFTPDGQDAESAVLNLKQAGGTLTGTAGPSDEQQMAIRSGKVDGDKISFEIALEGGDTIKFELMLAEEHLRGTASGEHEGQKRSAKLDVTRAK